MEKNNLIGKVVRLHSKVEPSKAKLYLVVDEKYTSFSQGKVTFETVLDWVTSGLEVTIYNTQYEHKVNLSGVCKFTP